VPPLPRTAPRSARAVARAAVLAVAVATCLVLPATPEARAAERCDGVWVVVDARAVGGGLTSRCAPGAPAHGLAALEAAGHRYTDVPRIPGMVCTIDRRPEPCNGAPADAYWSYWHAEAGGSWTYSTRGAGNRKPPPGSVEGWAFGSGQPPGTSPPANPPPPEPKPAPTESAEPSPAPSPAPPPKPDPKREPTPSASPSPSATPSPPAEPPASSAPGPGSAATPAGEGAGPGGEDGHRGTAEGAADAGTSTATPEADVGVDAPATTGATPPDPDGPARSSVVPLDRGEEVTAADDAGGDGTGADADAEEDRPSPELRATGSDDEVAIAAPSGGRATAGLVAGTALAASIAGAGAFQARRRRRGFGP
jgi:hypothetical protein